MKIKEKGETVNINEFCTLMKKNIIISPRNENWSCDFEECSDLKEGIFLRSTFQIGKTPNDALSKFIYSIKGQTIVFYGEKGEERIQMPNTLTI